MDNTEEKMFDIISKLLRQKELKRESKKWKDIPPELKKVLDSGMNGGIPREDANYIVCSVEKSILCLADYAAAETDFSATYLVYKNEIVYSYEN